MPLARNVVKDLAAEHGVCQRPVQLRRTEIDTGYIEQVLIPAGTGCPRAAPPAVTARPPATPRRKGPAPRPPLTTRHPRFPAPGRRSSAPAGTRQGRLRRRVRGRSAPLDPARRSQDAAPIRSREQSEACPRAGTEPVKPQ